MAHTLRSAAAGLALVAVLAGCQSAETGQAVRASTGAGSAEDFVPSADNPDPTDQIDGVLQVYYPSPQHVGRDGRVRYQYSPPLGGTHDYGWAGCTGVVYPTGIRTENAVHSLEHGAVWIAYNPEDLDDDDIDLLAARVDGVEYTLMSPYPGLDHPISVQSWGHQLKLEDADDPRIDQFIAATKQNSQAGVYPEDPTATGFPEPGATCSAVPGVFDLADPPPFDPRQGDVPDS
ncbi:uncharacterized protein DUF3105 [Williamsia limnetica]|uniref:Uncharacterized protein DUF3105 n=1 Tax=Williamsia limnetica TaxID=882452 RepID=A0A318RAE3_WILLI|nr:DUF3105 domain-containing protein [Williamsia limnetica]PYE12635.1 uncharacterized protein DUF3105 [Williamsia limnetica]